MFLLFQLIPWSEECRDLGMRTGIYWHHITVGRASAWPSRNATAEGAFVVPAAEQELPWNMGDSPGQPSFQVT